MCDVADMRDLQARIKEKDDKMAELLTLREELDAERRRAEELRMEMERSHEMEQSEKQRLVCSMDVEKPISVVSWEVVWCVTWM